MERRIKTAIEFLRDGQSFTIGEIRLENEKSGVIKVTGWSQYKNFANLTKQKSLRELEEIKALFYKMVKVSPDLRSFIENKSIEFNLYFDDYGKGSIGICSEKDKILAWEADLR